MILRGVTMENFGLFAGRNEFDLVPRQRGGEPSPIVLVGGKNGAGKTTLLEAVRLALYGRRALGARVGQSEYDAYLRGRVHRGAPRPAAAVSIAFDYAEAGEVHRYEVRRDWLVRERDVAESLSLDKDGVPVASVPREEWHQFLQELVPPGVSQLFFFDGEKIQEIADGEEDNEQLAEAVRGLLGIELVTRLRADLSLFVGRHQRSSRSDLTARLEKVGSDAAALGERVAALVEEVAELSTRRESLARAAERLRRRFVAEGGDAAAARTRLESDREEVRRRLEHTSNEMRDLANRLLPFTMAPRVVSSFRAALLRSGAGSADAAAAQAFASALLGWRTSSEPPREARWSERHWADLAGFVHAWTRGAGSEVAAFKEVGDGAVALGRLAEVESMARPRAIELRREIEALEQRGKRIDQELTRADNATGGILLEELRMADERVGAAEATLSARETDLRLARGQNVTIERERKLVEAEQAEGAGSFDRVAMAVRASKALAVYEARLLEHKLGQLEAEFVERFNRLVRKGDLISGVKIDRTTFAATLVDRDGRDVPKAALSAGEKQIYAISMLWALARTSGRPLPMIIDTPLARLDSEHRDNLIRRYFPNASHQVILLSTDTEVDDRLVTALGHNVSHAYRLDYDPALGRTVASDGYFGTSDARGAPRALQQA